MLFSSFLLDRAENFILTLMIMISSMIGLKFCVRFSWQLNCVERVIFNNTSQIKKPPYYKDLNIF